MRPAARAGAGLLARASLQFPEGRLCNLLRRLAFGSGQPLGQHPKYFVRPGETVVFAGMWRTETMQLWAQGLGSGVGKRSGAPGRLYVVEADPKNCEILGFEAARRELRNVTIINSALWSVATELTLSVKANSDSNVIKESQVRGTVHDLESPEFTVVEQRVPAQPLDEIMGLQGIQEVDHFHLTIGGSECEALRGMTKAIASRRCRLFVKSITSRKDTGKRLFAEVEQIVAQTGMRYHCVSRTPEGAGKALYAYWASRSGRRPRGGAGLG